MLLVGLSVDCVGDEEGAMVISGSDVVSGVRSLVGGGFGLLHTLSAMGDISSV